MMIYDYVWGGIFSGSCVREKVIRLRMDVGIGEWWYWIWMFG